MSKIATSWQNNPSKSAGVAYSSSAVAYNNSATPYSSANVGLAESGKLPDAWTKQSKTATLFASNPAAATNLYPFDSASHTYDSSVDTYDGVVAGQDFGDQETPTLWSAA